jgi:hypothetical protein
MVEYIQRKDGTFAGSIGAGKTQIPTSSPIIRHAVAIQQDGSTVETAYQTFSRERASVLIPDFADPETTADVLKRIGDLSLRYCDAIYSLRDRERSLSAARGGFGAHSRQKRVDLLIQEQDKIRDAIFVASQELHSAAQCLGLDSAPPARNEISAIIDADNLADRSESLSDAFDSSLQNAWDRGDLSTVDRVRRASRHVLGAKETLSVALAWVDMNPQVHDED